MNLRGDEKNTRFPLYGFIGLGIIILVEAALLVWHRVPSLSSHPIIWFLTIWTTPLCWWGYIFFADAFLFWRRGRSPLQTRFKVFLIQLFLSVAFWVVFEIYNLHLNNWHYVGRPENFWHLHIGYFFSFSTILPGLFLTSDLIGLTGLFDRLRMPSFQFRPGILWFIWLVGVCCLILPFLLSQNQARYLFVLVWLGFIFLFEPINYASGKESLFRDMEQGRLTRLANMMIAGFVCGGLWEFWNYWAQAKWIYSVPFTENIRIFEMPLAGFLGFGPFVWEYFAFYQFSKLLFPRLNQKRSKGQHFLLSCD